MIGVLCRYCDLGREKKASSLLLGMRRDGHWYMRSGNLPSYSVLHKHDKAGVPRASSCVGPFRQRLKIVCRSRLICARSAAPNGMRL